MKIHGYGFYFLGGFLCRRIKIHFLSMYNEVRRREEEIEEVERNTNNNDFV
jgi:hypothetical protein